MKENSVSINVPILGVKPRIRLFPLYVTLRCSSFTETDTTFREIPNKRVTSVMSTTTARTFTECCVKCMKTDRCQAVSVTKATDYVMCHLSDSTDTEDDPGSSVYTGGKTFKAIYLNLFRSPKKTIVICLIFSLLDKFKGISSSHYVN